MLAVCGGSAIAAHKNRAARLDRCRYEARPFLDRGQGDLLIVGINSDGSVRRNKGPGRPLTPARERAEIVAALRSVDAVFMYDELTPIAWIKLLKPHIHVKGADRTMDQIVEKEAVESAGGKVVRAPYLKNKSTTGIIAKIRLRRG